MTFFSKSQAQVKEDFQTLNLHFKNYNFTTLAIKCLE